MVGALDGMDNFKLRGYSVGMRTGSKFVELFISAGQARSGSKVYARAHPGRWLLKHRITSQPRFVSPRHSPHC